MHMARSASASAFVWLVQRNLKLSDQRNDLSYNVQQHNSCIPWPAYNMQMHLRIWYASIINSGGPAATTVHDWQSISEHARCMMERTSFNSNSSETICEICRLLWDWQHTFSSDLEEIGESCRGPGAKCPLELRAPMTTCLLHEVFTILSVQLGNLWQPNRPWSRAQHLQLQNHHFALYGASSKQKQSTAQYCSQNGQSIYMCTIPEQNLNLPVT